MAGSTYDRYFLKNIPAAVFEFIGRGVHAPLLRYIDINEIFRPF